MICSICKQEFRPKGYLNRLNKQGHKIGYIVFGCACDTPVWSCWTRAEYKLETGKDVRNIYRFKSKKGQS